MSLDENISLNQLHGTVLPSPISILPAQTDSTTPLSLEALLEHLRHLARQQGTYSVLNLVTAYAPTDLIRLGRHIYQNHSYSLAQAYISNEDQLVEALRLADSLCDIILLDIDRRRLFGPQMGASTARDLLQQTLLLTYSDGRTWAEALKDQLVRLMDEDIQGARIVIAGSDARSRSLAPKLADFGTQIAILINDDEVRNAPDLTRLSTEPAADIQYLPLAEIGTYAARADAVIVWRDLYESHLQALAAHIAEGAFLLDAGLRSLPPAVITAARQRGAFPVRVHLIPTLFGALVAAHEHALARAAFGWGEVAGIPIVAGGAIGEAGAVVVDSIQHPRRVLGIADSWGGLISDLSSDDLERLSQVREHLASSNPSL